MELIKYLRSNGRWGDAVLASINARSYFPHDFDLQLLHASSLNELGDYTAALKILDQIQVLPSEMSSASHEIFATANLLAGLEALAEKKIEEVFRKTKTDDFKDMIYSPLKKKNFLLSLKYKILLSSKIFP